MACANAAPISPYPPGTILDPPIQPANITIVKGASPLDLYDCNLDLFGGEFGAEPPLLLAFENRELFDIPILQFIANDPPRSDFTIIEKDIVPRLPHVKPVGNFNEQAAEDLNALINNTAHEGGLERAMLVSIERAQGAAIAGNAHWLKLQGQTAGKYAEQLVDFLNKDHGLIENVEHTLTSSGAQDVKITAQEVSNFQAQVAANGLPPGPVAEFMQLGADSSLIQQITNSILALSPKAVANVGGTIERLDDPTLNSITLKLVNALNKFAESTE